MNPIEVVLDKIQRAPEKPSSKALCDLLTALDTGELFSFKQLYNLLDYKEFSLALEVMRAWRLEEMRVTQGQLSGAVMQPESCYAAWHRMRQKDFGLQNA